MAENLVASTLYSKDGLSTVPVAPETIAAQVQINDENGNKSSVEAEIITLRQKIATAVDAGVHFKGAVDSATPLPTVAYKAGWQYMVKQAGTYAGHKCEVGDFLICVRDYASGSASNSDWSALQVNLDGVVSGPESSVAKNVATFADTTGKHLEDSGFTIAKSVPADAKFTDTTYAPATGEADGLLTAAMQQKLVGIEEGADKTDTDNVKAAGAFMKETDTADSLKDGTTLVVMTKVERDKLGGIGTGAEVNQNAFSSVKVGTQTITAGAKTDTLELAAGEGVTVTADAKKVTIGEQYIDVATVSSLDDVPANLRNGGLVIVKG